MFYSSLNSFIPSYLYFTMVILSELEESSSSSLTHRHHIYDVFLSFRGFDTRLSFTDHLHQALINANITTFLDDEEIETGLSLKPELERAIKASRASIIVLSENYASSTWCLDELVLILDQKRTSGHIVIPIFYHVEPTDVRKQQSSFGIAMAKHKQRMEDATNAEEKSQLAEKMNKWKKALAEVANLKGKDAKDRQETDFIEEIVTDIYHRLGAPLRSGLPFLCGMEMSIQFITSWLKDGSTHTADILTIFGLGGIGKTSLARYVHELHCRLFARSSFIDGVNEKCTQQVNGLLDLQKQLSHDISKTPIHIHDVFSYTCLIENALARQKVFIILDDIGSLEQMDALLGKKGFHPGSKIIITTKDASLNEKYAVIDSIVQPKHTKLYLEGLDQQASLQLLSCHAFKDNFPKKGYLEVSEKLMAYCQGHPLALKVLGESLHKRDVAEWEECIQGLKEETDSCIQKALQMSFNSISDNDKEVFKHIACFFVGKERKYTETILKACGIRALHGIKNLNDRCLLTIGPRNELKMHQLLQEMGRDVVRQESPNKPWKRSRLWCHKESLKVLKQKKGKGNLLGLALDMRMLEKDKLFDLKTDALSDMDNLMLLQLNYVQLSGSYKNFPEELRWLCMHGFPLKSIPSDLPMENLVALDLSYSDLEFFDMSNSSSQQPRKTKTLTGSCSKDKPLLKSLKILNLSFCKQLRTLGGFFELPALERLMLANCIGLIEVSQSIEQCSELVLIDLSYCNMLKRLPKTVFKLKKVETLLLDGCDLGNFPIKRRDMNLPKMLKSNNIGIKSKSSTSAIVKAIPRDLRSFMMPMPMSLVCLSLKDNRLSNESFPVDLSSLSMLKELYLDGNDIISLPNCVRTLPRLEKLSLENCLKLKTLEHPPSTLKCLNFYKWHSIQKIVFDQEMSPLTFFMDPFGAPCSHYVIEGMLKIEAMADVAEEVLHILGWKDLDYTKNLLMVNCWELTIKREVQMFYEFGIFSTIFEGMEMPNLISDRRKGSSISFAIPPSHNKLRGLNFCFVFTKTISYQVPDIRICNITKNRTWIYNRYSFSGDLASQGFICLSHWMFGKNEMEDGDQVTITINERDYYYDDDDFGTRECGVSLVYDDDDDDGKMEEEEEDVLGYYKSWNHIIGGDLSAFQTTTPGEYNLNHRHFFSGLIFSVAPSNEEYVFKFRAFSQRKFNEVGGTLEDVTK